MFLMAEPLRNLGRYTFADVASYRLQATPIRAMAATGTLVTGGLLPDCADGRRGPAHRTPVSVCLSRRRRLGRRAMVIYVTFGGMIATTWVQIIKATLLLIGATLMAILVLNASTSTSTPCSSRRSRSIRCTPRSCCPAPPSPTRSRRSRSHGADVRHRRTAHILMRFLHGRQRQGSAQVGVLGDHLHRLLLHPDLHHRLRRDRDGRADAIYHIGGDIAKGLLGGGNMPAIHLAHAVGGDLMKGFIAAVAFATILAVVSGLTLSGASAGEPRPLRLRVRHGRVDEAAEVRASRITTVVLALSPLCSASCSRRSTSRSWSDWPLRWRRAPTSRCCCCRCCGRG